MPRHLVGVAVVGGIIYAIGGHDVDGNHLTTVEAYHPTSDSWTTMLAMPTPRSYFGAVVVNGTIYAIGGDDAVSVLSTNEAFTP
jgi:N-acetylneuraminic acid mutarotase